MNFKPKKSFDYYESTKLEQSKYIFFFLQYINSNLKFRYYDPLMEIVNNNVGRKYYPSNEWFEKNLKQFIQRINLEKKVIKDSIVN